MPDCELHYLTKNAFTNILENNRNIDKLLSINKSIDEIVSQLKSEKYDLIIDLHNNIRTKSLKAKLNCKMSSFPKLNFKKWLLVKFKINRMPNKHVVDRYFEAVKCIGVENNLQGIEFPIAPSNTIDVEKELGVLPYHYRTIAIGAQFNTKKMPIELIAEVINQTNEPIVLIGGSMDSETAKEIITLAEGKIVIDATGKFNLQQSGSIVSQSNALLTNDTGMMHIATAFDTPIISVWGNTTPRLGMYPYRPGLESSSHIHQVDGLSCRPCSKIGFSECPKGHFNCMKMQDTRRIAKDFNS
jgi:ADP-heptose:LPS heptosyltransferase